jgi:HD-like signal output (HDOD) protein
MNQAPVEITDIGVRLREEIAQNQLHLPTLPEIALQVRDAVEEENTTAARVADIVAKDPALSARLLQVANSPLYRGRVEVDNLAMAVNRLGLKLVRSLVVSLAMKQMFQATSDHLDKAFRTVWDECMQVAAISRVLSKGLGTLAPEQAMLAGLVHRIGVLPILARLDELLGSSAQPQQIEQLVDELAPELGTAILAQWHFPDSLLNVPTDCLDLTRQRDQPDYADVVMVARLQYLMGIGRLPNDLDFAHISAFSRVDLEPEVIIMDVEGPAEEIAEVQALFSG